MTTRNPLRTVNLFAIAGALIWALTIFLRGTAVMRYEAALLILGSTPNVGSLWLAFGLLVWAFELLKQKPFDFGKSLRMIAFILALMLLSEILHHFFMHAPFDVWDMGASILAALILWIAIQYSRKKQDQP